MKRMDLMEWNRIANVLPFVTGRLLDLGCGYNNLVKEYKNNGGEGIGLDIHDWDGVDIVRDAVSLPFPDRSFDTVTIIGALNHMVKRKEVILESKRVLDDDGRLIITMIDERIGRLAHFLFRHDEENRGFRSGERLGLAYDDVETLTWDAGFYIHYKKRFQIYFNRLFILKKRPY